MKEIRNVRPFARPPSDEIEGLSAFASGPAEVSPDFVARVMRGLPSRSNPEKRLAGTWSLAAALLIFSAAAGYAFSVVQQTEDSVTSVFSTSASPEEIAGIVAGP